MTCKEKLHIKTHLAYAELKLRLFANNRNAKRDHALDRLHDYWRQAEFPRNTYVAGRRVPVFIDHFGTYCAVGYLMSETGYDNLAQSINRKDRFVFIEELDNWQVDNWLKEHGFSRKEAALIQPTYSEPWPTPTPTPIPNPPVHDTVVIERVSEHVSYNLGDIIMANLAIVTFLFLLACIILALRVVVKRPDPGAKRFKLALLANGALVAVIALIFLPGPFNLSQKETRREVVTCEIGGGSNSTELCRQFEDRTELPEGWRVVE